MALEQSGKACNGNLRTRALAQVSADVNIKGQDNADLVSMSAKEWCTESLSTSLSSICSVWDSSFVVWGQNCYPTNGSCTSRRPHTQRFLRRSFGRRNLAMILQHPSHSPDFAPCDFFLFSTMKDNLIHSFIHQWIYSPLLGPGLLFSFVIFFTQDGRTPWTGDQPVARPLPTQRTTQTEQTRARTHTHIHPLSGIWTHVPSVRASEDSSCLTPRGHCDRRRIISRDRILKPGRRFRKLWRRFYIISRRMASVNRWNSCISEGGNYSDRGHFTLLTAAYDYSIFI
jgi:hypothetical protein